MRISKKELLEIIEQNFQRGFDEQTYKLGLKEYPHFVAALVNGLRAGKTPMEAIIDLIHQRDKEYDNKVRYDGTKNKIEFNLDLSSTKQFVDAVNRMKEKVKTFNEELKSEQKKETMIGNVENK